ncbi:hypothetical protein EHW67_02330 [Arenibacter aquaticus]|uniref:Uncharacterized protein n=1 Tax=Arenibacter aquaticus TaxID=2489054 RepID=A0A3S0CNH6_9FLAO|nr:hypothetical protein [Arenibacter aquaticus]RTE55424.1 hypothetical protein EHW67_02330 [Arenibacter aquaticus]
MNYHRPIIPQFNKQLQLIRRCKTVIPKTTTLNQNKPKEYLKIDYIAHSASLLSHFNNAIAQGCTTIT